MWHSGQPWGFPDNRGMAETSPRQLLIPFAGRGSPSCRAALSTLRLPNLENLLSRLTLAETDTQDESTRSPPH